MSALQNILKRYDYSFPKELIAQKPASPRDSARLLVYDRRAHTSAYDTFKNIGKYLPKNSVLVLNQTKVIPARLTLTKPTGGKVRVLYIDNDKHHLRVLADRNLQEKAQLELTKTMSFTVIKKQGQYYYIQPSFAISKLWDILDRYGTTPIPPYIKHSPLSKKQLRNEYQSVFAKVQGSVAAPTASLHFTKALLEKLKRSGISIQFITLHVNLGTFASLTEDQIKTGKLHQESYAIDTATATFLNRAKQQHRPIIAVGTTVARTLESASNNHGRLKKLSGTTDLFIREGYQWMFIDGLITNFHVPKSSLLMLVAALVGKKKLLSLYQAVIKKKFRLFSFGDGMLII
jgi:S-adenosylmethionine:tRNA ribosyltransferase-isomerase